MTGINKNSSFSGHTTGVFKLLNKHFLSSKISYDADRQWVNDTTTNQTVFSPFDISCTKQIAHPITFGVFSNKLESNTSELKQLATRTPASHITYA